MVALAKCTVIALFILTTGLECQERLIFQSQSYGIKKNHIDIRYRIY